MNYDEVIVFDFETEAIELAPYPPRPVGLGIWFPGEEPQYFAFGHDSQNNCDEATARRALERAYNSAPVLAHHIQFDAHVARKAWGIWPKRGMHDSMIQVFLEDPRARSLALKESAERILGIPPEERDELRRWIMQQDFYKNRANTDMKWGSFISKAPGRMVEKYVLGDLTRPLALMRELHPAILAHGMEASYQRELKMVEVDLALTDRGVGVDVERLSHDVGVWEGEFEGFSDRMRSILRCGLEVNLDSMAEVADAMDAAGKVDTWVKTATGKRSTAADNIKLCCNDPELIDVMERRGIYKTCIYTFAKNWLYMAQADGRLHVTWNSTRNEDGGARTGRLSSSPNLQNIMKLMGEDDLAKMTPERAAFWRSLPNLRSYIIPHVGNVLIDRDYEQQELKALAHFEDGPLMALYKENPSLDIHAYAVEMFKEKFRRTVPRKNMKTIGFGLIYGMGVGKLALSMGCSVADAKEMKEAYLEIFPGIKDLDRAIKSRFKSGMPIRTHGGRVYYCEPPRLIVDKRTGEQKMRHYEYKGLNILVQGSCGDITKAAMISAYEAGLPVVLTIHDQLTADSPKSEEREQMECLRECMESVPLDVPLRSSGSRSEVSWAALEDCDGESQEKLGNRQWTAERNGGLFSHELPE